jgi:uncharacterized protein YndB with AHSA1/START domain
MNPLAHTLERTLTLSARRETVFTYLSASIRFATWWGAGSSIDPRPGGAVRIRHPNGVTASGEVLEIDPPRRMVFTYGYDDPAKGLVPGGSRVTLTLDEVSAGTILQLRHDLPDAASRDAHVPGWRFQLSLFANVATREAHADAGVTIHHFFTAWNTPDRQARQTLLATAATPGVTFLDAYAAVTGLDDLADHIAAVHAFMPGLVLAPAGEARQCQGTALCDWTAHDADGAPRGSGTHVFTLAPDGRIASCVGFWNT